MTSAHTHFRSPRTATRRARSTSAYTCVATCTARSASTNVATTGETPSTRANRSSMVEPPRVASSGTLVAAKARAPLAAMLARADGCELIRDELPAAVPPNPHERAAQIRVRRDAVEPAVQRG